MSRIETTLALPIRQMVSPARLAIGSAIALYGLALLLQGFLPPF